MCDFVQCTLPYSPIFSNSQELAGGSFPRSTHRRSPGPAGDLGGTQTPRQEVRPPHEEQQSKAFACSRKICVILFNAHYPISVRSKEKELIRMFEIVLGRGKWTCLKQNGNEQVTNIHNLTRALLKSK
jgi:hypothetical protein